MYVHVFTLHHNIPLMLPLPLFLQTFQLCAEGRRLLHCGEVFRQRDSSTWHKSQLLLFSDFLLLVDAEPNGSLRVTESPIYVHDLAGLEVHRKCASEFILYLHTSPSSLTLRAPSSHDKLMWKSLLEQRVDALGGGQMKHYGSHVDISNVKTSHVL